MIWTAHFESLRLQHVDLFLQSAIEIGMRDINGAKFKVFQSSQGKDNANGGVANCGSKCLFEIEARTLRIALCHQSRLVPVQGAVSVVLDLHEPSRTNCTLPRWQHDDLPSAI